MAATDVPLVKPHQPRNFKFPQWNFGQKTVVKRSFQASWFNKWTWLHYVEDKDLALCFACYKAKAENKLNWASNADEAFISKGFSNWKDASVKFANHESSNCHKEAVLKVVTLPAVTRDVAESLSEQHRQDKLERRKCFMKILSNIRFLARQGLALRGHGDKSDSNFMQLLLLRGEDDPRIENWIKKKTDKYVYTSPEMQNEMLKVMALHILRDIAASLHATSFITLMVDETTDEANKEQVVICLRWVDNGLEAHEEFIGLYEVANTESSTVLAVIRDVLLRLNISFTKLRGQCYDGASAMAGIRTGVATQILQDEPRAVFTHCYGHALNLACSDTIKQCQLMRNALDTVQEITKLVKKSPRRDATLQRIKEGLTEKSPGIRILCPTRWTVNADALYSIITNYDALCTLWEESLDTVKDVEMRSRIRGVSSYMHSFDFFFGVSLGEMILRHSDNLSKTLQGTRISAAEGQQVAQMTVQALKSVRTAEQFTLFWTKVTDMAEKLDVNEPQLPRKRKTTERFGSRPGGESHFPATVEDKFRQIFFEALDLIVTSIESRFDQPGYKVYKNLQQLLVKAANREDMGSEFEFVTDFYGQDFATRQLDCQLNILSTNIPGSQQDVVSVLNYLKTLPDTQKMLLSEV